MPKTELSIIIISYNTREVTLNCIHSILNSRISVLYEIVVLDNASTDDSVDSLEKLAKEHSELKLIKNKQNLGFGRGNNAAAKHAQGQYIFFLNSDTLVLDDAVDKLVSYFKSHEETIHFLGGKLLNKDKSPQASAGPFFTPAVIFGFLFLRGDYWGLTRYSPTKPRAVDWVSGACILTKKEHFESVGGFDEQIFMYMEEIDLLYRARKKGFRAYFYPEARFTHLGSASSEGRSFPILQVYKGYLYFYKKHYGGASLFILKIMLQLKAKIAILIGRTTKNDYLIHTYEEAYNVATMA